MRTPASRKESRTSGLRSNPYAEFRPEFQESPILRPIAILRTFPERMTGASDPEATAIAFRGRPRGRRTIEGIPAAGVSVDTVDDHGPEPDPAQRPQKARGGVRPPRDAERRIAGERSGCDETSGP